jgi:hypothetical protein
MRRIAKLEDRCGSSVIETRSPVDRLQNKNRASEAPSDLALFIPGY